MAANKQRANLPSDPEVLLEIMQELPDDSGSEDEFDGYLDEEDGPIVLRASGRCSDESYTSAQLPRSRSVASLRETVVALESPLPALSPSGPAHSADGLESPTLSLETMESPTPSLQSPSSNPLTVRGNNPYTHISIHNVLLRMQKPVFTGTPGVVPDMDGKLPIDYFRPMFDDRVLNLILTETTRYAEQYLEREEAYLEQHPTARAHDWRRNPLSMKELEVFLSIVLAMGICGFPTMR